MEVVRSMFPNVTVPEPTDFFFPRWNSNPLYRGSYSNWPPSFFSQHHDNLRANVGRLYFAGEATSRKYFGAYARVWRTPYMNLTSGMNNRVFAWRLFWRIGYWSGNSWLCQVGLFVLRRFGTFCSSYKCLSLRDIMICYYLIIECLWVVLVSCQDHPHAWTDRIALAYDSTTCQTLLTAYITHNGSSCVHYDASVRRRGRRRECDNCYRRQAMHNRKTDDRCFTSQDKPIRILTEPMSLPKFNSIQFVIVALLSLPVSSIADCRTWDEI